MIRRRLKTRYSSIWDRDKVQKWKNKMENIPCFIIGNAPSLDDYPVHLLNDLFTIGINRAFKKIDTTIMLWQDIELYYSCRKEFKNIKSILYARDAADPQGIAYHFKLLNTPYQLTNTPTVLAGRGSSAPLAFQLAHSLGCNPIVFLGYDCRYRDRKTDFWGINKDHKTHTLKACSRGLTWIKNSKHSRKLFFCPESDKTLKRIPLETILKECGITKKSYKKREYFAKKLFE